MNAKKQARLKWLMVAGVLVCSASLIGLIYIISNKPEVYITPGIVVSKQVSVENQFSNKSTNPMLQFHPLHTTVHYNVTPYKEMMPMAQSSSMRGMYLTSRAQAHSVGGGIKTGYGIAMTSHNSSSSRGITYNGGQYAMPVTNFVALTSSRQVANPEASEAPQLAHLVSSEPRRAPGPPTPGDLPDDHQLVEHPVGEGIWCLIVMAVLFAGIRTYQRIRRNDVSKA